MPPLPIVSGMKAREAFERCGWVFERQKGSHMILKKEGHRFPLSIPNHYELDRGTLRALIRNANLTTDQFEKLLEM